MVEERRGQGLDGRGQGMDGSGRKGTGEEWLKREGRRDIRG